MDIEKLIEHLKTCARLGDSPIMDGFAVIADKRKLDVAATALSTLQEENAKLLAELEKVKAELEEERTDFIDCVCSGVSNYAPYCRNRKPDCVDKRGWCICAMCHGFSREKED